jgi:uncharacterized protein (DUF2252 family)
MSLDPRGLAALQLQWDRERTAAYPDLYERKVARMASSPFAFLRGAAPLFYHILAAVPDLAAGPEGEGWIVGDLHAENFGAYRPMSHHADDTLEHEDASDFSNVAFSLNDFDDAIVGPLRLDLIRFTTSLLLAFRSIGLKGSEAVAACDLMLQAYCSAFFDGIEPAVVPRAVDELVRRSSARSAKELLEDRTEVRGHRRVFMRGPRYRDLPDEILAELPRALDRYADSLTNGEKAHRKHWTVADASHRIAGTGSLGVLRVAILLGIKDGKEPRWILDMKAEGQPSACLLGIAARPDGAQRVVDATRALLQMPPRMLGVTELQGQSMFVRRLAPQEDKIDFLTVRSAESVGLAAFFGSLVGKAHKRAVTIAPKRPWTASDREAILERAIRLCGLHEAIYLWHGRLTAAKRVG